MLGVLSGSGSSDATAYTSNEIKYNYLTAKQRAEVVAYYSCLYGHTKCSDSEKETLEKRVKELEAISLQQTKAMMDACYDGPSPQCLAMIEEAKSYINWIHVFIPPPVNHVDPVDTISAKTFDRTAAGMFAPILDEMLVDAYSSGLYGDDALKYVNQSIIRYNSTIGLAGDVIVIGGSAIVIGTTCAATVGTTCVLAVAAGALAANDLIKNGQQLYTGEEALSLIEQGLMKTGMSQEDATYTLQLIETGVAIASVVDGGIVIISMVKSNKVIAITKPSFPNKDVANAVSNEGKLLDGAGDAGKGSSTASSVAQTKTTGATSLIKNWKKIITFRGNKVYQRDDLIDPRRIDPKTGKTSLEKMLEGTAPIGPDGKPINLHHGLQTQNGPIFEITQTAHQQYGNVIHINPNTIPTGINRNTFEAWKKTYWKERAKGFM